jgi:hypothetical protein
MVNFTVAAHGTRRPAPAADVTPTHSGTSYGWIGPLAAIAAVLLAATVRRDSTYRRRGRRA